MDLPDKSALLARVKPHRGGFAPAFRPANVEPVGPGQESVWDYPRPPVLVPAPKTVRVMNGDTIVAESARALEVKETAGGPVPYIPPQDVRTDLLRANGRVSVCEWKGAAMSHDFVDGDVHIPDVAWTYPDPFDDLREGYAAIAGWFAFYPARLACFVGAERARPQPGGFYGGWITDRIKGPVKGEPGTQGW